MHPIKDSIPLLSTRLLENKITKPSTSLVDPNQVEAMLAANQDVVDAKWVARHAKFIYLNGLAAYLGLADKARKYGRNPKALMATLINKSLGRN